MKNPAASANLEGLEFSTRWGHHQAPSAHTRTILPTYTGLFNLHPGHVCATQEGKSRGYGRAGSASNVRADVRACSGRPH